MIFDLITIWAVIKTATFFAGLAAGIAFIFMIDDREANEEYKRRNPEEFGRYRS